MVLSMSIDGFTAGTPVEALTDDRDALLAVGMNGQPLPTDHGYPARLVVPGLYGYVSATKWVVDLELTRFDRAEAYWTRLGWSPRGPIKTESRIDVPRSGQDVAQGPVTFGGVAWAQNRGVRAVEVRIDDGDWQPADLGAELLQRHLAAVELRLAGRRNPGRTRSRCGPPTTPARCRRPSGRPGPRRRHRLAHGVVRGQVTSRERPCLHADTPENPVQMRSLALLGGPMRKRAAFRGGGAQPTCWEMSDARARLGSCSSSTSPPRRPRSARRRRGWPRSPASPTCCAAPASEDDAEAGRRRRVLAVRRAAATPDRRRLGGAALAAAAGGRAVADRAATSTPRSPRSARSRARDRRRGGPSSSTDLFAAATDAEQTFLRRLLGGELRQGALVGVMADAVAKAAGVPAAGGAARGDAGRRPARRRGRRADRR